MDMKALVEDMVRSGGFNRVMNDPRAQLGVPARQYLGTSLLPEKLVPVNEYTEENVQFRTIIANAGTRYSPVQKKGGMLTGAMRVSLGNSDIGNEIKGDDYDALIRLIDRYTAPPATIDVAGRPDFSVQAMNQIFQWADLTLNRPLLEHNEKNRWDALVDAQVNLVGDDGYKETINYPNPTGQRVAAGGTWSNSAYDPWADIIAGSEFLASKGYTVTRIITSTTVRSKLSLNAKVIARLAHLRVDVSGNIANQIPGRARLSQLNDLLGEDGLPPIELYDLQYRTNTSSGFFLKRTVMLMVATTGRDRTIDLADIQPMNVPPTINIPNTVGYTAIGRAAGQQGPGRVMYAKAIPDSKPPRIEGEAWQTSIPVVTDPEAVFVITGIS